MPSLCGKQLRDAYFITKDSHLRVILSGVSNCMSSAIPTRCIDEPIVIAEMSYWPPENVSIKEATEVEPCENFA